MRLAAALGILLAGCAAQPETILCPPLHHYTAAQQIELGEELPGAGPQVQREIMDYGALSNGIDAACPKPIRP